MMNLSSLSKALYATGAVLAFGTLALVAQGALGGRGAMTFSALAVLSAAYGLWNLRKTQAAVATASRVCHDVGWGDFEVRVLNITEKGDLGELHNNLNHLIDRTDAFIRESQAAVQAVKNNIYYRRILPHGLDGAFAVGARLINEATETIQKRVGAFAMSVEDFEKAMNGIVTGLGDASEKMNATARDLESSTQTANGRASAVAAASEQTAANLQTVSTAASELANGATQIGEQIAMSAQIAQEAVAKTQHSSQIINGLDQAAAKIGKVIELINTIADQTNLLALNATIEAASAGEAGRGFTVVANEVKSLANQTAKATEEIAAHIRQVQDGSREAVNAIGDVSEAIDRISQITTSVSAAVEEQNRATESIAVNVEQVFESTKEVSHNIDGVRKSTEGINQMATNVLGASEALGEYADILSRELKSFMITLRRGPLDRRQGRNPHYTGPERRKQPDANAAERSRNWQGARRAA